MPARRDPAAPAFAEPGEHAVVAARLESHVRRAQGSEYRATFEAFLVIDGRETSWSCPHAHQSVAAASRCRHAVVADAVDWLHADAADTTVVEVDGHGRWPGLMEVRRTVTFATGGTGEACKRWQFADRYDLAGPPPVPAMI